MISNRCARKSLVTNCNSIISKNYLRFLVDSNDHKTQININFILSLTKKQNYEKTSNSIPVGGCAVNI